MPDPTPLPVTPSSARALAAARPKEDEERWRTIPGWEGFYEVSDYGRVRSVDREVDCLDGRCLRFRGKVLSPAGRGGGYLGVNLCRPGKSVTVRVHHLVLLAFIGKPVIDNAQTNHMDGDKSNNRLSNLEWVSPAENSRHAEENGLCPSGSDRCNAKLDEAGVARARRLHRAGISISSLATRYPVSRESLRRAIRGLTWCHVEEPPIPLPVSKRNSRGG